MDKQNTQFKNLVELHAHLGSSTTPVLLWEMAHEQGIKLPDKDYWKFIDSVTITENTTYEEYLNYFHLTEKIQSSLWGVEKAVHNAISLSYRKSAITTIEIRFNPMLRNHGGDSDLDKIILSAAYGLKKAMIEYPVKAGLILMMDRRFTPEQNLAIAKKAAKYKQEGIVGLDVGGPLNDDFSIDKISDAFNIARQAGLKLTFHTGEATGPEEMFEVIEKIDPDRIGHGVRSIEAESLLKLLAKKEIALEVCPSSNLLISLVNSWDEFKDIFSTFEKYNVGYTINSDNPVMLGTNVANEFGQLIKHGVLEYEDVKRLSDYARSVSFIK
jgi:adenosine deaminase